MSSTLYVSASGMSGIENVRLSTSHSSGVSTAIIMCNSHTVDINDSVTVYLGYSDNHPVVFTGYVKQINRKYMEDLFTITIYDVMVKATDYFIAPSNPEQPYSRMNISAEDLVGEVFAMAGLTDYEYDTSYFTFGIHNPVEVKLVAVYEFNKQIADLLAFHIYADINGVVHFKNRLPYLMDTDIANRTVTNDEIIESDYTITEEALRNRVVVYGTSDIYAEASEPSPYLPTGFYKSVVYASPYIVQDTAMAQQIADHNLEVLNKLTYKLSLVIPGRPEIMARDVISVTDTKQGITDQLWYAFAVEHTFSRTGYITQLELRR